MTTEPTPDQIARLPRWAKTKLNKLTQAEHRIAELEAQLASDPEGSDTFIDDYVHPIRPLGERPSIRFGHDRHGSLEVRFVEDGVIEVRGSGGGSGELAIEPRAANSINIRVREQRSR